MALSVDTVIIRSPLDDDMESESGYVHVFVILDNGTWQEVKKLTPASGEAGDFFGLSVAI